MTSIGQTRQILMNELGLTRESVRQLVEQIVTDTVSRHMKSMETSGTLYRIVSNAFENEYDDPKNRYTRFRDLVTKAAEAQAREFVQRHLSLNAAPAPSSDDR